MLATLKTSTINLCGSDGRESAARVLRCAPLIHQLCACGALALAVALIATAWRPAGAQSHVAEPTVGLAGPRLPSPTQGPVLPPAYPVQPWAQKLVTPPLRHDGWSFVVSAGGHSADLFDSSTDRWTYDPGASRGDLKAGLAWQHGDTTTIVGFSQFDQGRLPGAAPVAGRPKSSRGVLGLSTRIKLP